MATKGSFLEKALKAAGGRQEFDRKFQQYTQSVAFIDKHRDELLKKYDENWVAVYDAKVVAHGKKYQDLAKEINKERLPIGDVVIKFLTSRKMLTLF